MKDHAALMDRGVIEIVGMEARSFLQRLVTSDVESLLDGEARYAALLTPQGKITADFFIVPAGDVVYLDTPETLVAGLVQKLTMYRLRAKIRIADRSADLGVVAFRDADPPADAVASYADPRAPGLWHRAIVARSTLQDQGGDAARWAYRQGRIRAGVPEGGIDFVYGETFPHEANLDRLHGVDFRKGCYVGQEVVSRVEHRGTARKRVVGLSFEGEPPAVGSDITVDGLSVGTMGSAIEGLGLGLVRLDRLGADGGGLRAGDVALRVTNSGWSSGTKSA